MVTQMVEHSKYWRIVLDTIAMPQGTGLNILDKALVYLDHAEGRTHFQKNENSRFHCFTRLPNLTAFCLS